MSNDIKLKNLKDTIISKHIQSITVKRIISINTFRSSSSLSDVMESFQDQLNVQDVDQSADRLRFVLLHFNSRMHGRCNKAAIFI
jgi:hypothetical protein